MKVWNGYELLLTKSERILKSLWIKPVKSYAVDLGIGIAERVEYWTILLWIELQVISVP